MKITLYKHVERLKFDDTAAIILFSNKLNYGAQYDAYINPAKFWAGEGKTYNIGVVEVCEVPIEAIKNEDPIYIKVEAYGRMRYYNVTSIEFLPQKARLYISLDTFATYYEKARFDDIIVNKSTLKIASGALFPLMDEVSPINAENYVKQGIARLGLNDDIVFVVKVKYLSAKSISNEAYMARLLTFTIPDVPTGGSWINEAKGLYNKIVNIYEMVAQAGIPGVGLACQIEEIYLLPSTYFITQPFPTSARYIDINTGQSAELNNIGLITGANTPLRLQLNAPTAAPNKLIIGHNEIILPTYYEPGNITIKPVYNVTDFDLILQYQNEQPQSIKEYFQCQISNSTNETSLQKIARWAGYALNIRNAAGGAVIGTATGGAMGAIAGAMQIKGASDNVTAGMIATATREALPATSFNSEGFDVYILDTGDLNPYYIYQKLCKTPATDAITEMSLFGVAWNRRINSLEELLSLSTIMNGRKYIECSISCVGIPTNYANEITNLLSGGVEVVGG